MIQQTLQKSQEINMSLNHDRSEKGVKPALMMTLVFEDLHLSLAVG